MPDTTNVRTNESLDTNNKAKSNHLKNLMSFQYNDITKTQLKQKQDDKNTWTENDLSKRLLSLFLKMIPSKLQKQMVVLLFLMLYSVLSTLFSSRAKNAFNEVASSLNVYSLDCCSSSLVVGLSLPKFSGFQLPLFIFH